MPYKVDGASTTKERTITTFNIGEKVRYKTLENGGISSEWVGLEAEVTETGLGWAGHNVKLKITKTTNKLGSYYGNGATAVLNVAQLELIEEPFKVGDRVMVKQSYEPHGGNVFATRKGKVTLFNEKADAVHIKFDNDGKRYETGAFAAEYVEHISEEPAETLFEVGDTVEFREDYDSSKTGDRGTVTKGNSYFGGLVRVDLGDGKKTECFAYRLKKVGAETFTFKDIQEGDRIRRTYTYISGAAVSREGVVTDVDANRAQDTKTLLTLAFVSDDSNENVTLELVNRPEPVKEPKLWEDRAIGDKIIRKEATQLTVFTKTDEDEWESLYLTNGTSKSHTGGEFSDYDLAIILAGHELELVKA